MASISVGAIKEDVRNNVSALAKALDGDLLQKYDIDRVIEMDFIRNYGQLSTADPNLIQSPIPARNPIEIDNFDIFKDNVGYDYKQTGRQRDDKQKLEFYPIKLLGKDGKPKTYNDDQIYLNDVPTVPVTDENDAEKRSFTPLRDDYIFIIYPEVTIRGVKQLDYMRFKTPTCPPCLETILPTGYQTGDRITESEWQDINIVREIAPSSAIPILHRPKYERNAEGQTVKDAQGNPYRVDNDGNRTDDYYLDYDGSDSNPEWKGDYNWESYTFWQITRILDVPQGFQAFFTRGLSIIY